MSHESWIVIPEIDNELEFVIPVRNYDKEVWFHLQDRIGELQIYLDAIDFYYQYMIEKLSGLTDKNEEEWILYKLQSTRR